MNEIMTEKDILQIKRQNQSLEKVNQDLDLFKKEFPFLPIIKPAIINDGIIKIPDQEQENFISRYDRSIGNYKIVKFVPASGAASRMFKKLHSFYDKYKEVKNQSKVLTDYPKVARVIENLPKFAFYSDLQQVIMKDGDTIESLLKDGKYTKIIAYLLFEIGLDYSNLPKGLLKFHSYNGFERTPVEEQLVEGAMYCKGKKNRVYLHFTVSEEHISFFKKLVEQKISHLEKTFDCTYDVSFSFQAPSTDCIAVNLDNTPFRNKDNSLLFRPGGHGALIENLNQIDADLVFIKNIDNVVPDSFKKDTIHYKRLLGGIMMFVKEKIHQFLKDLDEERTNLDEIIEFVNLYFKTSFSQSNTGINFDLKGFLNRPIRVCGMVFNTGEPGGGPFWVQKNGQLSLQIVESSQVDLEDPSAKQIFDKSTHFNPVDLVCSTKNYKGEKFDLIQYIDKDTGFITTKSKDGIDLKAMELPGLWNGAMSDWLTIFVEVPNSTFNPVKEVNDLLRTEHQ
ncbi:MAG: DUF4301 family protein [Cyclobacteriaceae bacterium]|nr:DUF4301 family protein [Cyclobacteriaceae bacterium]